MQTTYTKSREKKTLYNATVRVESDRFELNWIELKSASGVRFISFQLIPVTLHYTVKTYRGCTSTTKTHGRRGPLFVDSPFTEVQTLQLRFVVVLLYNMLQAVQRIHTKNRSSGVWA